ncbi:Gfo/Idh/MocA family protein [Tardiphaga sp.]|uniref:Gfo/Idh/MocA family protein n=1 Tax=Tardiphaga sp. TaxID=1926292 RepID=UPI003529F5BE
MIDAAIVGLGRWGRNLVEAAVDHGRLNIRRAVEPMMGEAQDFCAKHQLELSDNLSAVLADETITAILLATPHSMHPAQVIACAAARKNVFCEKPLALHYADARAMLHACRSAGVPLAVGHNRRFWPAMQALRDIVASGELGTLLHIEGHNSNENSQNVTAGWRLSPEESPGGGLTGAGLHALDAFVSLLGPVRTVHAKFTSREQGPPPLDTTILMLEFENGVTGTLATVRATPLFWRIHIFGTKGSAEVLDETTLILRNSGRSPQLRVFPAIDVLRAELDAFADMIETGSPFPVPDSDVLATLTAFEAGLKSIELGETITCDRQEPERP